MGVKSVGRLTKRSTLRRSRRRASSASYLARCSGAPQDVIGLVDLEHAHAGFWAGVEIRVKALGEPAVDRGDDVRVCVNIHLEHLVVVLAPAHAAPPMGEYPPMTAGARPGRGRSAGHGVEGTTAMRVVAAVRSARCSPRLAPPLIPPPAADPAAGGWSRRPSCRRPPLLRTAAREPPVAPSTRRRPPSSRRRPSSPRAPSCAQPPGSRRPSGARAPLQRTGPPIWRPANFAVRRGRTNFAGPPVCRCRLDTPDVERSTASNELRAADRPAPSRGLIRSVPANTIPGRRSFAGCATNSGAIRSVAPIICDARSGLRPMRRPGPGFVRGQRTRLRQTPPQPGDGAPTGRVRRFGRQAARPWRQVTDCTHRACHGGGHDRQKAPDRRRRRPRILLDRGRRVRLLPGSSAGWAAGQVSCSAPSSWVPTLRLATTGSRGSDTCCFRSAAGGRRPLLLGTAPGRELMQPAGEPVAAPGRLRVAS